LELLILHSNSRAAELAPLVSRLSQDGISPEFWPFPDRWAVVHADALAVALRTHSHWLLMPAPLDRAHPAFVFAAGFGTGVGERCYLYDTEGYGAGSFHVYESADALAEALFSERRRWQQLQSRRTARDLIAERGLEVSLSAYFETASLGDVAACRLYLDAGFSPDLSDQKGVSVLSRAVRAGHLAVVRLLLDAGADVNHLSRDRGNSALMDAAADGQTDIVAELLARGADLSGVSRNGQNVLVLAVGRGAEDTAALLLDAGADPFVADKLGSDAVRYAHLLGRKRFLELVKAKFPERI